MAEEMELEGIEEATESPEAVPQALVLLTTLLLLVAIVVVMLQLGRDYETGMFK